MVEREVELQQPYVRSEEEVGGELGSREGSVEEMPGCQRRLTISSFFSRDR